MKANFLTLQELNKNYRKKRSKLMVAFCVLFAIYVVLLLIHSTFCCIYIRAEVIGYSMQPTFNAKLEYPEKAEDSIYKDVVYANRFKTGTNGDIVLIQTAKEIVIKRIIATENQVLTLTKSKEDNLYYFYLANEIGAEPKLLTEEYIGQYRAYMNDSYYARFVDKEHGAGATETSVLPGMSATLIIPKGHVFVLGDNRWLSEDSTTYGPVKTENILGLVSFYHSYNQNLLQYIWHELCSIF